MSATLSCNNDQTLFVPKCYSIGAAFSGGMLSDNPHAGIYEADSARTLDQSGGDPSCNQGGIAVVEGPTYAMTPCTYTQVVEEQVPTLTARDFKDPTVVNRGYSVRRLTATECARLQGFPDWWCAGLDTPEPTEADIAFWAEVWKPTARWWVPPASPRPGTRSSSGCGIPTPMPQSIRCGGTAAPCPASFCAGWHCVVYTI